jgi:transposase
VAHPNARLTPYGRGQVIRHHRDGYTQAAIAEMMGVSRATVCKWLRRYHREGVAGLGDRSSRPHRTARRLSADLVAAICRLRRERAWGPHRIAYALRIARSTVYAVLRRAGLQRLAWLHRSTREVIRYERAAPGELVHLDVKKLGRIPDGGGKRWEALRPRLPGHGRRPACRPWTGPRLHPCRHRRPQPLRLRGGAP